MTDFTLSGGGRVVLVTGGAAGLGANFCTLFGEAGYRPVIVDMNRNKAEQLQIQLTDKKVESLFISADVGVPDEVARAMDQAVSHFGRIDVVVNNAGILGACHPIHELDIEDVERVLAINLKGPMWVCKHAVAHMKKQGGGSIINIGSTTADAGAAYFVPYAAAKSGMVALTKSMARHVGRFNIRVNCIQPGSLWGTDFNKGMGMDDPITRQKVRLSLIQKMPTGQLIQARDIAGLGLFLDSPLGKNIHGAVLTVDGGEHLGYQ